MNKLLFLFPSVGALIGIISVLITYYCLWRRLNTYKMFIINVISEKLDSPDTSRETDEILEDRLETFIKDLRNQIPMGSMLLTPSLSIKIKGLAKEGILKMLPGLKEKLLERLAYEISIESILLKAIRSDLIKIIIYAAVTGFVIGLIWTLFL